MRVHYRDSDAFGGGAGVQVVLSRTFVNASGNAQNQPVCFWASNAHGTGATTAAKASRSCAHDLAADSFYHVDVSWGSSPVTPPSSSASTSRHRPRRPHGRELGAWSFGHFAIS